MGVPYLTHKQRNIIVYQLSISKGRWPQVLILIVMILSSAGLAGAHAQPVRSEPAADARIDSAPSHVTIYFSELLEAAGSSINVIDASGTTVSTGSAQVLAEDNTALRVALRSGLGSGQYTVQWQSRSAADGDDANGSFGFTVAAPGPGATLAPATAQQLPQTGLGSNNGMAWISLAGIALLLAGLALVALPRPTNQTPNKADRSPAR
jgi:methionine-rich copper-binding protein CopC